MPTTNGTATADDDTASDDDAVSEYYDVSIKSGQFSILDNLIASGNMQEAHLGDDGSTLLQLPFSFPYFDTCYSHGALLANGLFMLGSITSPDAYYTVTGPMTADEDPYSTLAFFWADLNPGAQGSTYYGNATGKSHSPFSVHDALFHHNVHLALSGMFGVYFDTVGLYSDASKNVTVQMALYANGSFAISVLSASPTTQAVSVGFRGASTPFQGGESAYYVADSGSTHQPPSMLLWADLCKCA